MELICDNISFSYNKDVQVFRNFSHTFKPGITVLKGYSGSGKTTLLKLLAGYLKVTGGRIITPTGLRVTSRRYHQRGVAYMFQGINPSGKALHMDAMLPFFQKLPFADVLFRDFLFSGFALLIVNGLTNLTAAVLLLRKKPLGVLLGGIFGITLMLWIGIQFYMFPLNFMSTAYFIFGLCQAVTGFMAWMLLHREEEKSER